MKLIGMLDSPYVRRVAISFDLLGIKFEHDSLSVFSSFKEFHGVNPVVKAPTLICDNGQIIMDSALIIDYAETVLAGKSLMPADKQTGYSIVSHALAACDKTVGIAYERKLRPTDKQHQAWMDRICAQAVAAFKAIEVIYQQRGDDPAAATLTQDNITTAAAWQFSQIMTPDIIVYDEYPAIIALSKKLESTKTFIKYPPLGPGILPNE